MKMIAGDHRRYLSLYKMFNGLTIGMSFVFFLKSYIFSCYNALVLIALRLDYHDRNNALDSFLINFSF